MTLPPLFFGAHAAGINVDLDRLYESRLLIVDVAAESGIVHSAKRGRVYRTTPLVARFWAKVDKNGPVPAHRPELGPCWLWTGSRDDKGYGGIREGAKHSPLLKAHRVSWAIHFGPLSADLLVLHKCDNPPCVRDTHLFTGSSADNSRDAAEKGRNIFQTHPERHPRGERVGGAKLTVAVIEEIHELRSAGWTQTRIAKRFGVTQANVSLILKRKTWRPNV